MTRFIAVFVSILSAIIIAFSVHVCFACDWVDRCEPYRDQVLRILEEQDVSADYYYLMIAESRCTPKAQSSTGAQGFWQLLPATAKRYGCSDPHDLECATIAAAGYIRHLESMFDSFDDVIIAYNMGGHNYLKRKPTGEALGLVRKVRGLMQCR